MENKPDVHTFSYIVISGRLFDEYCLVSATERSYLNMLMDLYGIMTPGSLHEDSVSVNASPVDLFNTLGSKGFHIVSHSSGHSSILKTWVMQNEGPQCSCLCHAHFEQTVEGGSPPKRRRYTDPNKQHRDLMLNKQSVYENYRQLLQQLQIPVVNSNSLSAEELFATLSTTGFLVPFKL